MLIESISVYDFGTISRYETTFRNGFNEIQAFAVPELTAAMGLVLRNKVPSCSKLWIQNTTKIEAVVQTKQTDYRVALTPNRDQSGFSLSAFDHTGADQTSQYLLTFSNGSKEDSRNIFRGGNRNIYFALKYCDREGKRKSGRSLSERTNDILYMQAFHAYRRRYVMSFKPIPIRNGFFLLLREDGSFAVEDTRHNLCTGRLSETDERLARYLCFLQVAAFWDGFEQIRNMHYERKPLILLDFLEFLNTSVLASGKLQHADNFGYQILALTFFPCNESRAAH